MLPTLTITNQSPYCSQIGMYAMCRKDRGKAAPGAISFLVALPLSQIMSRQAFVNGVVVVSVHKCVGGMGGRDCQAEFPPILKSVSCLDTMPPPTYGVP